MMEEIIADAFYTESETSQILGNLGKTKMQTLRKEGILVPFRTRPTIYLGSTIIESKTKIVEYETRKRKEKMERNVAEVQRKYGLW